MPTPLCIATTNTFPESCVTAYTRRLSKPWRVSTEALVFLGVWESGTLNGINFQGQVVTDGYILKAYRDNRGYPTVGAGHLIVPNDRIALGETIDLERARGLMKVDIARAENAINRDARVPLYQFEYDALVSVIYNCGAGNGAVGIMERINAGAYDSMFDFIHRYRTHNNPSLRNRRFAEARLFVSGVYDASH